MKIEDFKILEILFAFVSRTNSFNSIDDTKKGRFVDDLSKVIGGSPMILPIPKDAPKDIPRYNLSSTNNNLQLTITAERADLKFISISPLDSPEITYISKELKVKILKVLDIFIKYNVVVDGIGLLTKYFSQDDIESFEKEFRKVFSQDASDKLIGQDSKMINFSISNPESVLIDQTSLQLNISKSISNTLIFLDFDNTTKRLGLIEFDINTFNTQLPSVTREVIDSFISTYETKFTNFVQILFTITA